MKRGNFLFPQVNSAQENVFVVRMVEEALLVDSTDHWPESHDYWMGGKKLENGSWTWQSGEPLNFTNWCPGCADREGFDYLQLAKHSWVGSHDTFYWSPIHNGVADNGVICERKQTNSGTHILAMSKTDDN